MQYLIVIFLLLSLTAPSKAEEKWLRLKTPNFEIYTPQSEKKARETALYFEQLRDFFLNYWGTKAEPGTPVRIVLFGNEKQYIPFRPYEKAAGYFSHGIDRDWIVLSNLPGWERIVCHEYTHLMVKQSGLSIPVWLNEGLAEIYSTFKPLGPKVQVGDLIPGHFYAVQTGWIPLSRLTEVKHDSPEYNGKDTAQFYAESWGLTHMLMLEQENRKTYAPILSKLVRGGTWADALKDTTLDLKKLDLELQNYMKRNDRFFASLIPYKSTRPDVEWIAERINPAEVDATLALLQLNLRKKEDEVNTRIAKLDPATWQSQETLAYAAWRKGELKTAKEHFAKAINLGATSAKLHYDAARASMYSGDRGKESVAYLEKAVNLYPEWTDAKLQLVEQYLYVGDNRKAFDTASAIKRIGPAQASRLFRGLAYSEAMIGGPTAADSSVRRANEFARTEHDKAECARLDQFLAMKKQNAELQLAAQMRAIRESADREDSTGFGDGAAEADESERPAIRRGELGVVESPSGRETVQRVTDSIAFEGLLINIECAGAFPVLRFDTPESKGLELDMRDPSKVNLEVLQPGEVLKPLELNCGDQKRKVKASYAKPGTGQTRGQLRTIQYID